MIGGQSKLGAVAQNSGKPHQSFLIDQPAFVVPCLWPRVGEKGESAVDRSLGQGVDHLEPIAMLDADIYQPFAFDMGQQGGNAVFVDLASNQSDPGIGSRLPGDMFASAKTDLQPDR